MAEYTEHITIEGERWDNIAYAAYGDPQAINGIIEANPTVPLGSVLPGGIRLLIPIIEPIVTEVDASLLPPWK